MWQLADMDMQHALAESYPVEVGLKPLEKLYCRLLGHTLCIAGNAVCNPVVGCYCFHCFILCASRQHSLYARQVSHVLPVHKHMCQKSASNTEL